MTNTTISGPAIAAGPEAIASGVGRFPRLRFFFAFLLVTECYSDVTSIDKLTFSS